MITVDHRSLKERWEAAKYWASCKWVDAKEWMKAHPEVTFLAASTTIGFLSYAGKKTIKAVEDNREIRMVECRHYDPRSGENWYTRRPLKSAEQLRLDREYADGHSKGEILAKMGLLK